MPSKEDFLLLSLQVVLMNMDIVQLSRRWIVQELVMWKRTNFNNTATMLASVQTTLSTAFPSSIVLLCLFFFSIDEATFFLVLSMLLKRIQNQFILNNNINYYYHCSYLLRRPLMIFTAVLLHLLDDTGRYAACRLFVQVDCHTKPGSEASV